MINKRLLVICNAIDDETRFDRKIVTDSPAATRKVFLMCKALRGIGIDARVISLGRGRVNKDGKHYRAVKKNISGVPTYYLPFNTAPFLSQLVTLIFATTSILKYRKYKGKTTIMFYNRMPAYIGALLVSKLLKFYRVLDLEDGETTNRLRSMLMKAFYDNFCSKGAVLACSALESETSCRPVYCYYGINTNTYTNNRSWHHKKINIIFSGTILKDTGASLLIETIKILRKDSPIWAKEIEFIITGKGEEIGGFLNLQAELNAPLVRVLGRLSKKKYNEIIKNTHVGLSLKIKDGHYSNTTFPSKVIEFSSNYMLVISTKISDVSKVLGFDGALFIDSDQPYDLIKQIKWIVQNKGEAEKVANIGNKNINSFTHPINAPKDLAHFLF
jgi:glycosyltransferase involved in cell wall biosynthesis